MMKKSRDLVSKFIKDPDTLVIAVVPANTRRIRDSQALQLVQEANAQARTIGVLTMPDLSYDMRKKKNPYWELKERLEGKAQDLVELGQGYVAVKNRDTEAEAETKIMQVAEDEVKWFAENLHEFDASTVVGVDALLQKLDGLINAHIRFKWVPRIQGHIEKKRQDTNNRKQQLGVNPSQLTLDTLIAEAKRQLQPTNQDLNKVIDGISRTFVLPKVFPQHWNQRALSSYEKAQVGRAPPYVCILYTVAHFELYCCSYARRWWENWGTHATRAHHPRTTAALLGISSSC
jgi:hypothetical protein